MFILKSIFEIPPPRSEMTKIGQEGTYWRSNPKWVNRELLDVGVAHNLDLFLNIPTPKTTQPWISKIRNGVMFKHGLVTTEAHEIVSETLYNYVNRNSFYGFTLDNEGIYNNTAVPERMITGQVACLRLTTEDTYGHWLLELIPRIENYERLLGESTSWQFAISATGALRVMTRKMLAMLGYDDDRILELPDQPIQVEQLVVSSIGSLYPWWISPKSVRFLQRLISSNAAYKPRLRLFVTRDDAKDRYLENSDEVYKALVPYGFTKINTNSMTISQQIDIYSRAEVVVGVIGSALANIIFCNHGTPIVFLSPNTMAGVWFYDLASIKSLPYAVVYGNASQAERTYRSNFFVSTLDISSALKALHFSA